MSKKPPPPLERQPPGRIRTTRRRRVIRLRVKDREFDDWRARAKRADISLSEFVRARVEAGNREEDALTAATS